MTIGFAAVWRKLLHLPAFTIIGLIRAYQYAISPLLGRSCRFDPSCSEYAVQSFRTHGTIRGGWLALKRISRCHPWHPGGYDPVP